MSKQAFKRVRRALKMQVSRNPLEAFAWPGGYPIVYVFTDGGRGRLKAQEMETWLIGVLYGLEWKSAHG